MNLVALIGNLANEVELKELGEDRKVASFRLAVDRRSADAGADFFRITVWGKQADACARYLAKGRRVGVEGRLRSSSWEDADGKRRSSIEVFAHSVEFLSVPAKAEGTPFEDAVAHS